MEVDRIKTLLKNIATSVGAGEWVWRIEGEFGGWCKCVGCEEVVEVERKGGELVVINPRCKQKLLYCLKTQIEAEAPDVR